MEMRLGSTLLKLLAVCVALLSSLPTFAHQGPSVKLVRDKSELPQGLHKDASMYLEKGTVIFDPRQYPKFEKHVKAITDLLKHQILETDRSQEIHFIFIDSMLPNAFFMRDPKTQHTFVGITIGALAFLENTDQLACILGHELEHGESQIEEEIAKQSNTEQYRQRYENAALRRTEEIEVDVKSMFRRVLRKGFNPHAWLHLADRFRNRKQAPSFSHTHAEWEARGDAMALALANEKRVTGTIVPADEPGNYKPGVIAEIQVDFMHSPELAARQKEFWRAELSKKRHWAKRGAENMDFRFLRSDDVEKEMMAWAWNIFGDALLDEITEFKFRKQVLEVMATFWMRTASTVAAKDGKIKLERAGDFIAALNFFENQPLGLRWLGLEFIAVTTRDLNNGKRRVDQQKKEELLKALRFAKSMLPDWQKVEKRAERYLELAYTLNDDDVDEKKVKAEMQALVEEHEREFPPKLAAMVAMQAEYKKKIVAEIPDFVQRQLRNPARWNELSMFMLEARKVGYEHPPADEMLRVMFETASALVGKKKQGKRDKKEQLAKVLNQKDLTMVMNWLTNPYDKENQVRLKDPAVRELLKQILIVSSFDDKSFVEIKSALRAESEPLLEEAKPYLKKHPVPGAEQAVATFFAKIEPDANGKSPDPKNLGVAHSEKQLAEIIEKYNLEGEPLYKRMAEAFADAYLEHVSAFGIAKMSRVEVTNVVYLMFDSAKHIPASVTAEELHRSLKTLANAESIRSFLRTNSYARFSFGGDLWFETVASKLPLEAGFKLYREVFAVIQPGFQFKFKPTSFTEFALKFVDWVQAHDDLTAGERRAFLSMLLKESNLNGTDSSKHEIYDKYLARVKAQSFKRRSGESAAVYFARVLRDAKDFDNDAFFRVADLGDELTPKEQWQLFRDPVLQIKLLSHVNVFSFDEKTLSFTDPATGLYVTFKRPSVFDLVMTDAKFRDEIGLDEVSKVFIHFITGTSFTEEIEAYFDTWWKLTEKRPDLRRLFEAKYVKKFKYDADRVRVAEWQLEDKFHIEANAKLVREKGAEARKKPGVRKIIRQIREYIKVQFPELGSVRDLLFDKVESKFATNEAETHLLHEIRTNAKNWTSAKSAIAASDLPHMAARRMLKGPADRLAILEYLIGLRASNPVREIRQRQDKEVSEFALKNDEESLDKLKQSFLDSGLEVRTYTLMTLLDKNEGVLADAAATKQLTTGLLSGRADDALTRALVEAYLESVGIAERQVLFARISAEKSHVGTKGHVSLAQVLQMMGPLGIKAGQFLRSSGLVGPELQEELKNLLNKAAPPNRTEIFKRLKKLLGTNYSDFTYVGEIVGSGSINYVVRAQHLDPKTKRSREVVIRVLRSAVEGQAANEADIWKRAAEILRASNDPKQIEMADLLDEARETAMRTLQAGGQELDLGNEARWHKKVAKAYEVSGKKGAFAIEVARPHDEMLNNLSEEAKKAVAIYDRVDGIALWDVTDVKLRAQLAQQILRAELGAIFKHGVFDPDSHLGNWIIDLKNKRLVRIDYSQALDFSPDLKRDIQAFTKLLLKPSWSKGNVKKLAELFPELFTVKQRPSRQALEKVIAKIAKDPKLPKFSEPQERLFFFRKQVELSLSGKLKVGTRPELQAVFASLGKLVGLGEHMKATKFYATWMMSLKLNPFNYLRECVLYLLK